MLYEIRPSPTSLSSILFERLNPLVCGASASTKSRSDALCKTLEFLDRRSWHRITPQKKNCGRDVALRCPDAPKCLHAASFYPRQFACFANRLLMLASFFRSEERRVGKECRSRWS